MKRKRASDESQDDPSSAPPDPLPPPAPTFPRDGGVLLAAAGGFGAISWFTLIEKVHLGRGAIPTWVPLAVDAAIAGVCGAVLVLGGRWFSDDREPTPDGMVVVAKPVWEQVQREIVAVRKAKAAVAGLAAPGAPTPLLAAAPVSVATIHPWDEGPPGPAPVAPSPAPAPVPAPPARAPAAATPRASPAPPTPVPPEPELTRAELDEIARMGGILGVVPTKTETGREFSARLARAREEQGAGTPPAPTPPASGASAPPAAGTGAGPTASEDIDELMAWLDKIVTEPPGEAFASPAKKPAPKDPARTETKSSP